MEKLAGPPVAVVSDPSLAASMCRAVVAEPFQVALAALRYHRHTAMDGQPAAPTQTAPSEEQMSEEGARMGAGAGVGAGVKGGILNGRLDQMLQSLTWRFVQSLPGA